MTFKDQTFRLLPDGTTQNEDTIMSRPVSYTHLTLPTILLV